MDADTAALNRSPRRLLLQGLRQGWLPVPVAVVVAASGVAAAVVAGGTGVGVTFRPPPSPLAPLDSVVTVGVCRAPLSSGPVPRVGPWPIRRRRWVQRVTTPRKLDTAGTPSTALPTLATPGTLAALGTLAAPDTAYGGDRYLDEAGCVTYCRVVVDATDTLCARLLRWQSFVRGCITIF